MAKMRCASVTSVSVLLCLLVVIHTEVKAETDADLTVIKTGMRKMLQKLIDIDKRLTKLEKIPAEVHDIKLLMTSLVNKNGGNKKNGAGQKISTLHTHNKSSVETVTEKSNTPRDILAPPHKSNRPKSSRPVSGSVHSKKNSFRIVMTEQPKKRRPVLAPTLLQSTPKSVKTKAGSVHSKKTNFRITMTEQPKKPRTVLAQAPLPSTPKSVKPKEISALVLASTKKTFILDFKTKTWTELAVTPHPDSLLYDDVHHRLYWTTRKPGAVGFFTGKDWTSQVLYQRNNTVTETIALNNQDGSIFLIETKNQMRQFGHRLVVLGLNGHVNSTARLLVNPYETVIQMIVDAPKRTLYVFAEHLHGHYRRRHIRSLAMIGMSAFNFKGQAKRGLRMRLFGEINAVAFDDHAFSMFYNKGKALHQMKMGVKISPRGRQVIDCDGKIQLITTSKQHVYLFDKHSVYVYDRQFHLKDTLPLPDLNDDKLKAAAFVSLL